MGGVNAAHHLSKERCVTQSNVVYLDKPKIAVIVPTLCSTEAKQTFSAKCIQTCVDNADFPANWVLVSDGGFPPPQTAADMVIINRDREGFEYSANVGAEAAVQAWSPDALMFLNDDVVGYRGWLRHLAALLVQYDTAMVIPSYTQGKELLRPPPSSADEPYQIVPRAFALMMRRWAWELVGPWVGDKSMQYPCDYHIAQLMALHGIGCLLEPKAHIHHFAEVSEWHFDQADMSERKRRGMEAYCKYWQTENDGWPMMPNAFGTCRIGPKHYDDTGWPHGCRDEGVENPSLDTFDDWNSEPPKLKWTAAGSTDTA